MFPLTRRHLDVHSLTISWLTSWWWVGHDVFDQETLTFSDERGEKEDVLPLFFGRGFKSSGGNAKH